MTECMVVDHGQAYRVFGAALDASDDPLAIGLKHAAMDAAENGVGDFYADLYDAIAPCLPGLNRRIELIGKVAIPSWLASRPLPVDRGLVSRERMEAFVRGGGLLRLSTQLKSFVQEKVFPAAPVMLGVDHSATGGVVSALSEELGPENLGIVVIDQHFDCLPISLRVGTGSLVGLSLPGETGVLHGAGNDDEYCCGDFWKYLIDSGVVLPENLMFIGVADYPEKEASPGWETYRENYLRFEKLGCSFFPLREFEGRYAEKLQTFVKENVATPHVYVSLDLDVGSYRCVHAARYMDREGIDRSALMGIARIVGESARAGKFRLAGVDIMEFNVHFLELETPGGTKDETLGVARDFLAELLVGESV